MFLILRKLGGQIGLSHGISGHLVEGTPTPAWHQRRFSFLTFPPQAETDSATAGQATQRVAVVALRRQGVIRI